MARTLNCGPEPILDHFHDRERPDIALRAEIPEPVVKPELMRQPRLETEL